MSDPSQVFIGVLLTDNLLRKSGFPLGPFHENRTALEHCSDCWGVLGVPGGTCNVLLTYGAHD